jgi:hypothetical protein
MLNKGIEELENIIKPLLSKSSTSSNTNKPIEESKVSKPL